LGFSWAERLKQGDVLALFGELGAGKTTFVTGVAAGLGVVGSVLSPSFVIVRQYEIGVGGKGRFLYHIDLFRLKDKKDLEEIGIKEILKEKDGVVIIEWADRCEEMLPDKVIKIYFKYLGEDKREIKAKES